MYCSLDYSIPTADALSTSLDTIIYEGLTPGLALTQSITVVPVQDPTQQLRQLSTTYTADNNGRIVISGLARLFNGLIMLANEPVPDDTALWNAVNVIFAYTTTTEQAQCARTVFYSRGTAQKQLQNLHKAFPYLHRQIELVPRRPMPVFFPITYSPTIELGIATADDNGNGKWITLSQTYNTPPAYRRYDLQALEGIDSARYAVIRMVINGECTDTFRIDFIRQRSVASIFYTNFLGIIERIDAFGADDLSVDRTATFGYADNRYTALDLQCHDSHELYLGYAGQGTVDRVRDLLASPAVWIYYPDNDTYDDIVITAAEQSSRRPTATPDTFRISYRMRNENQRFSPLIIPSPSPGKIFSEPPFNDTFA